MILFVAQRRFDDINTTEMSSNRVVGHDAAGCRISRRLSGLSNSACHGDAMYTMGAIEANKILND